MVFGIWVEYEFKFRFYLNFGDLRKVMINLGFDFFFWKIELKIESFLEEEMWEIGRERVLGEWLDICE